MKSEAMQKIGVLDALTAGLTQAARRPWLLLIPLTVDLILWLAPRLTISGLLERTLRVWEALVRATYTAAQLTQMNEMLTSVRQGMTLLGSESNLTEVITGSWLSAPSIVATGASTRLTFLSDMVLASAGVNLKLPRLAAAPWQGATVEIGSWWAVIALSVGGWLVSQLVATLYLRWAARSWMTGQNQEGQAADPWAGPAGLLQLALRLTAFSVLLGVLMFFLRVPLGVTATLMLMSGSGATTLLFLFVGGMTLWLLLWFLASFFFAGEAMVLDRQPVLKGIGQSLILMRLNGWPTLGLVIIINVVLLGFRAVWGLIGQTPVGAGVALVGNAYLATGMLLGVFTYYGELRRRWQVLKEKASRQAAKEK